MKWGGGNATRCESVKAHRLQFVLTVAGHCATSTFIGYVTYRVRAGTGS